MIHYSKNFMNKIFGGTYSGEKDMGSLDNWRVLSADSNGLLYGSYDILSSRSTTLYHTYPPARAAINKQLDYSIGPGLVYRSQPDWQTLGISRADAAAWARDFQKIIDSYYRRFNWYEKQSVTARGAMSAGDALVFLERENGLLTDLIEMQNCEIDSSFNSKVLNNSGYTLGILHDEKLRRKGIKRTNGKTTMFKDSAGNQDLLQFYLKELPRQLRGYPFIYSIINMARNDDTHTDAITHRAVMEAIIMATFKGNGTDLPKQAKNLADANRAKKGRHWNPLSKIANAANMGAGSIFQFNAGEELSFTDLQTPSKNFGEFKGWMVKYCGMATGTPPESILGEYSTSFTAHKGAINDLKLSSNNKRKSFARNVNDPINSAILTDAIKNRYIEAPGFLTGDWRIVQAYLSGVYLGPIPGHINPLVEVKAQAEQVKQGFELRSTFANLNGHEYENFLEEWQKQQDEYSRVAPDFQNRLLFEEELRKQEEEKSENKGAE